MTDMKVLRIASVVARTGLARPTIYKLMASGKFKIASGSKAIVKFTLSGKTEEQVRLTIK